VRVYYRQASSAATSNVISYLTAADRSAARSTRSGARPIFPGHLIPVQGVRFPSLISWLILRAYFPGRYMSYLYCSAWF
jgi:hypothetical protein